MIRARPAGLKPAREWMEHYVAGWNFSFDRLDELMKKEMRKESDI
jgi:hypothetical protein